MSSTNANGGGSDMRTGVVNNSSDFTLPCLSGLSRLNLGSSDASSAAATAPGTSLSDLVAAHFSKQQPAADVSIRDESNSNLFSRPESGSAVSLASLAARERDDGHLISPLFGATICRKGSAVQDSRRRFSPPDESSSDVIADIDLTSALLSEPPLKTNAKSESIKPTPPSTKNNLGLDVELLFLSELNAVYKSSSHLPTPAAPPSRLARVICKRWKIKGNGKSQDLISAFLPDHHQNSRRTVERFKFDVPSPDDVVKAAQSKVFKKRP